MFEALFQFILNIFFWIIGVIGSIIIYPIQAIIVTIFPTLGEFVGTTLAFFTERLFPMISYIKEVILVYSCIPKPLYLIFIGTVILKWTIAPSVRAIKFVYNMWRVYRGTI